MTFALMLSAAIVAKLISNFQRQSKIVLTAADILWWFRCTR